MRARAGHEVPPMSSSITIKGHESSDNNQQGKLWWERHVAQQHKLLRRLSPREDPIVLPILAPKPNNSPRRLPALSPRVHRDDRAGGMAPSYIAGRAQMQLPNYPPFGSFLPGELESLMAKVTKKVPVIPEKPWQVQKIPGPVVPTTETEPDPEELQAMLAKEARKKEKGEELRKAAELALNVKFSDIRKAFIYYDLDNSGTIDAEELKRAIKFFNIPLDEEALQGMIEKCDKDGDGQISYDEFVDSLSRDTVAMAAMGKRGMQAQEAMGVNAYAHITDIHGFKDKYAPKYKSETQRFKDFMERMESEGIELGPSRIDP